MKVRTMCIRGPHRVDKSQAVRFLLCKQTWGGQTQTHGSIGNRRGRIVALSCICSIVAAWHFSCIICRLKRMPRSSMLQPRMGTLGRSRHLTQRQGTPWRRGFTSNTCMTTWRVWRYLYKYMIYHAMHILCLMNDVVRQYMYTVHIYI